MDYGKISKRFNETTGAIGYISAAGYTGADHHPDRCICQGTDTTPHKHYKEPPYECGRCVECKGFVPVNLTVHPEAANGVILLTTEDWDDLVYVLSYVAGITPSDVYAQECDELRGRIEKQRAM